MFTKNKCIEFLLRNFDPSPGMFSFIINFDQVSFHYKREDFLVSTLSVSKLDGNEEKRGPDDMTAGLHLNDIIASPDNVVCRNSKHLQEFSRRT